MSTDDNLEVIRQVDRAWNARDWFTFDRLHARTVFARFTHPHGGRGRDSHHVEVEAFLSAFPDHEILFPYVQLFGQGEWVCSVFRSRGTHRGPLHLEGDRVIPPTGRSFELESVSVSRIVDGQLCEETTWFDSFDFFRQLGVVELAAERVTPPPLGVESWTEGEPEPVTH